MCFGILSGCAGLDAQSMAPDLSAQHYSSSQRTLCVLPVTGEYKSSRVAAPVSPEMLRETVVLAFRKANLFAAVVTSGDADLSLKINILSQRDAANRGGRGWEHRRQVIVEYELLDRAGNGVWKNTISTTAGSTAFGGAKAVVESSAGSVRENVKALVIVAAEQWPRNADAR